MDAAKRCPRFLPQLLTRRFTQSTILHVRPSAFLLAMLSAATLQGCVFVLAHSYSNVAVDRRPIVSQSDWDYGILHLFEPGVEDLTVDLTHRIETTCAEGKLVNVQTKVIMREFVLVQIYSVRLTAQCAVSASPTVASHNSE
jgi:hypothetical protein